MYNAIDKDIIRQEIVSKFKIFSDNNTNIVMLESPKKLAIKCMQENLVKFNTCYIPNNQEKINLTNKEKLKYIHFNTSLGELVPQLNNISGMWADYCCSYDKCKDDLIDSFKNNIFSKKFYYAITVSARGNRKFNNKAMGLFDINTVVIKDILDLCNNHDIKVNLDINKIYRGGSGKGNPMYTLAFIGEQN